MDGIINVYKEKGFTSHDVVAKLRGILKQKKIGHTGTLDPDATGVLPVCLGKGTKLCDMLTDKDKTYEAVLLLGITTDTQDITGKILETREVNVTEEEILFCINGFVGEYDQIPPMYSALKVNGKKLYELAREGKEIERQPRRVNIINIDVKDISKDLKEVTMTVSCSKGTYIRTLCTDIGEKLGCGGCMKSLIRTKVSRFSIDDSLKLNEIESLVKENRIEEFVISVEEMFQTLPTITVLEEYNGLVNNGNPIRKEHVSQEIATSEKNQYRVYSSDHRFIGIYEYDTEKRMYRPRKMF